MHRPQPSSVSKTKDSVIYKYGNKEHGGWGVSLGGLENIPAHPAEMQTEQGLEREELGGRGCFKLRRNRRLLVITMPRNS